MADGYIICPKCKARIPLSKALSAEVEQRVRQLAEGQIKRREQEIAAQFEKRLEAERNAAAGKAKKEAKAELADLAEQLKEKDAELDRARRDEVALRKRQRELEEKAKTIDLEVARKVEEAAKDVEKRTAERFAEQHRLKDREKDEQLSALKRTVEELQGRLEQGSQQARGEAGELELESILRSAFPHDLIEPIGKGVHGADLIQRVHTASGATCGSILWECKSTKNWSDAWRAKLRDDQRQAKAEIAVLVSLALPAEIKRFAYSDGVWVCDFPSALGLATALRMQLLGLHGARAAAEGKAGKMELLYAYLSGTDFRHRVEAIVEAFTTMQEDLGRERASTERSWAKRERQISSVVQNVAGLYGDMQGIIGATLPDIQQLQLSEAPLPPMLTP